VALWNGRDPILKERPFGLTGNEGNHGEDVKECYYYLDSTPMHSYMKYLYKYPQAAYPYEWLINENRSRGRGRRNPMHRPPSYRNNGTVLRDIQPDRKPSEGATVNHSS
jgi:hypothetical protein